MSNIRESALSALLAWNAARVEVNRLKSERNAHRCTEACRYDHETGDPGQAECWRLGDTENMCDECKERQKLTEPIQWAVRKASELRQKMQRQAVRLQKVECVSLSSEAERAGESRAQRNDPSTNLETR